MRSATYLQNALKVTRKEAEQLSRDEERNKEERDKMAGSAAWLKKMSLRQFLGWFDCVETVTVKNKRAKTRWSIESTMRDRLVLHMLEKKYDGTVGRGLTLNRGDGI